MASSDESKLLMTGCQQETGNEPTPAPPSTPRLPLSLRFFPVLGIMSPSKSKGLRGVVAFVLQRCLRLIRHRASTSPEDLLISLPTSVRLMRHGIRIPPPPPPPQKKGRGKEKHPSSDLLLAPHDNSCRPRSAPAAIAPR